MKVFKSFFYAGIYDPNVFESWPYYFHDEGVYLSKNQRKCSIRKAAEFETENQVRAFYHSWKNRERFKLKLVEIQKWVDVEDPEYPSHHPLSVVKKIRAGGERPRLVMAALIWFSGADPFEYLSKRTKIIYRDRLLKYGIDISQPPSEEMRRMWDAAKPAYDTSLALSRTQKPTLVR